jgi:peptidoglycan-associated lipoprotein
MVDPVSTFPDMETAADPDTADRYRSPEAFGARRETQEVDSVSTFPDMETPTDPDTGRETQEERMKDRILTQAFRTVMVGSLIVTFTACSKMNVMSTTDGTDREQVGSTDQAKGGPGSGGNSGRSPGREKRGGGAGSEPLTGFSKGPAEESVSGTGPLMLSKADPGSPGSRKMREPARRGLADIYFALDQWELTEEGRKNLAESADFLREHPRMKVLIEGHCDERGTIEYNLALGEKRAREARQYLADLGVKNVLGVTSFGKERPVFEEPDESCYWRNRRARVAIDDEQ